MAEVIEKSPLPPFDKGGKKRRRRVVKTASDLGQEVREYREVMGLSQTQFGELAGISRNLVSLIERGLGNPTMKTLTRIEAVVEVRIEELQNAQGDLLAIYVRGAWCDPELFRRAAKLRTGIIAVRVRHLYMRLMPNGQPYLLKDEIERGWWMATVWEAKDHAPVRYRHVGSKRYFRV